MSQIQTAGKDRVEDRDMVMRHSRYQRIVSVLVTKFCQERMHRDSYRGTVQMESLSSRKSEVCIKGICVCLILSTRGR